MTLRTLLKLSLAVALSLAAFLRAEPLRAEEQVLHEERSLYRNIRVIRDGDQVCLLFRAREGLGRESCQRPSNPKYLVFEYGRMMLGALYLNPNPKKVLIIGLGGATIPSAIQEMLPNAQLDVVELDEAVERVAKDYFHFVPGPHTKIYIEDGRVFVKRMTRQNPQYDLVMLDAFEDDYIPEHMLTQDFFKEVKSIMAPNGVLAANTFSSSVLYNNESQTYHSVFGPFFNLKSANRIILTKLDGLPDKETIRANANRLEPEFSPRQTGAGFLIPLMSTDVDWDTNARILTDQYSPSNVLNAMGRTY